MQTITCKIFLCIYAFLYGLARIGGEDTGGGSNRKIQTSSSTKPRQINIRGHSRDLVQYQTKTCLGDISQGTGMEG